MATLEKSMEEKPWSIEQIKGKTFRGNTYVLKIDDESPEILWFCREIDGKLEPEDRNDCTSPCIE